MNEKKANLRSTAKFGTLIIGFLYTFEQSLFSHMEKGPTSGGVVSLSNITIAPKVSTHAKTKYRAMAKVNE